MITIRSTCRLCESRLLWTVLSLPPTPIGDSYTETPEPDVEKFPLTLVRCESCKLLQLREVIDPDTLYGHYRYRTADSLGLSDYFSRYSEEVLRGLSDTRPDSITHQPYVVDIGSNDGTLLRAFEKRGCRAIGIDPVTDGPKDYQGLWNANTGLAISRSDGQADIITANNVLANVDDIHDFMEGVRTLLAPDGIFVCETGSGPDLIASRLYDCIYHEHLSYFGLNQLVKLFAQHGLFVVKAVHTDSKGGCLRVTAKLAQRNAFYFAPQEQREPTHADLAWFRRGLEQTMCDLKNWCSDHQGKYLAGYGASVGVTTLRYALDVPQGLSFFVDDNPSRQGLFVPGNAAEVVDMSRMYRWPGQTVMILFTWRYADVILAKHQAFLEAGGVILQPLPTFIVHTAESYARRLASA